MPTKNENWDPNSDVLPICDECEIVCDGGYSMHWGKEIIEKIMCFRCRDRADLKEYEKTGRLTSHFMTTAILKVMQAKREPQRFAKQWLQYEKPQRDVERVEDAIGLFRRTVWPVVWKQVDDERTFKGMRVDVGDLKILAFAMCGRIRIQIERGDAWCSAQGTDESATHGIGLHGISATADEAIALWKDAIEAFKNGAVLVGTKDVGIL